VTAGQVHESTQAEAVIGQAIACRIGCRRRQRRRRGKPRKLAADKGYSVPRVRDWLKAQGIRPVIPHKDNEVARWDDPRVDGVLVEPPAFADFLAWELVRLGQLVECGLGDLQILRQLVHGHDVVSIYRHRTAPQHLWSPGRDNFEYCPYFAGTYKPEAQNAETADFSTFARKSLWLLG
jgi:hypothetical protein